MTSAAVVFLLLFVHHPLGAAALTTDGLLLLSLKYYSIFDPHSTLSSWNYSDLSPCSWNGVVCAAVDDDKSPGRVVSLLLPGAAIAGVLPPDLALVQHLRHLDLSGNYLDGPLPAAQLFRNASELRILNLAGNRLTGRLPAEFVGNARELQSLNLSGNAISGEIPNDLGKLLNLTVVSLARNNFSGELPATGFLSAQVLDFSSNRLDGGLPANFTGPDIRVLNLSSNHLSGQIPAEFARNVQSSAVLDFSHNDLTGEIPEDLRSLDSGSFSGNVGLCGRPVERPCVPAAAPSSLAESPPAIAARPIDGDDGSEAAIQPPSKPRFLKPAVIAVIVIGNLAVIGIIAIILLCLVQMKKKSLKTPITVQKGSSRASGELPSPEPAPPATWCCMGRRPAGRGSEQGNVIDTTESETETDTDSDADPATRSGNKGRLVTLDGGDSGLETEALLKASAYILGVSGNGIVYKAVLDVGTAFAVRRITDTQVGRLKDFEGQVRLYAKLRHPNLVRIRGFYWGVDEKLLIYDYATNGSLAGLPFKKKGTSPLNLTWEVRVKVARGVARGLAYLHDKKHVHGNLKPSNILLGEDNEPMISDFGLERALIAGGDKSSTRQFGSNRSTVSRVDSDGGGQVPMVLASPSGSLGGGGWPGYQAPESLRNLKQNPKWDVYSFGIVLLELLTGRVLGEREVSQWNTGFIAEDRVGVLRMVDVGLRSETEGTDEALLATFRLGFQCAHLNPQRRPTMKEALQILEKLPS